jgi:hypothetical protein
MAKAWISLEKQRFAQVSPFNPNKPSLVSVTFYPRAAIKAKRGAVASLANRVRSSGGGWTGKKVKNIENGTEQH